MIGQKDFTLKNRSNKRYVYRYINRGDTMSESHEKSYWSKEIAGTVGIADSTLRKWCRLLETAGYRFVKDDNNRRAFTERDAILLKQLKILTYEKGIALDTAINAVIARFGDGATRDIPLPGTPAVPQDDKRYDQIMERFDQQEAFNKALLDRLDRQTEYIEQSIKKRDENLMQVLKDMQETKKQIAAANEKKSWLKKLFKK